MSDDLPYADPNPFRNSFSWVARMREILICLASILAFFGFILVEDLTTKIIFLAICVVITPFLVTRSSLKR